MTKHLRIILSLILLMSVSAAKASTLYYVVDNISYAVTQMTVLLWWLLMVLTKT